MQSTRSIQLFWCATIRGAANVKDDDDPGDGFGSSAAETALGVERLVAGHLKLVRLELVKDAKTLGRNLRGLLIVAAVALVGYVLVAIGVSVALSHWMELGGAFLLLGGLHGAAAATYGFMRWARLRAAARANARGQSAE